MSVRIEHGDSREVVKTLADGSVDAVCTDPPYGIAFMGRAWDAANTTAFDAEFWAGILRVLKPGGHLVAFGGCRTYHRLACAIEDAGFEIRDQLAWTYASGFPKSHNVGKAIDKAAGAERELTRAGTVQRNGYGDDWDTGLGASRPRYDRPATEAARQWDGYGTALKPSWEPIVLARKPLSGTVAANVLAHGVGAINVDACRVATSEDDAAAMARCNTPGSGRMKPGGSPIGTFVRSSATGELDTSKGRWPANLVHDGSEEVLQAFAQFGERSSGSFNGNRESGKFGGVYGEFKGAKGERPYEGNSGSAARFFFSAKADADDRCDSKHPTVKPVALMRWLARLITPPVAFACESCDKTRHDKSTKAAGGVSPVRDVRDSVQASGQPDQKAVLLQGMRDNGDASIAGTEMRTLRKEVQTGSGVEGGALLFEDLRKPSDLRKAGEGVCDDAARLPATTPPEPSSRDKGRLHHGTQGCGGGDAGAPALGERDRASHKRAQGRQSAGKSGGNDEERARHDSEARTEADHLSPLRRENQSIRTCAACGGALTERRGLVLDPFAGSGTTGVACIREGFDAILIEREAEYVRDIHHRIDKLSGLDAPLFARAAE